MKCVNLHDAASCVNPNDELIFIESLNYLLNNFQQAGEAYTYSDAMF
jgi:hypothetical protein